MKRARERGLSFIPERGLEARARRARLELLALPRPVVHQVVEQRIQQRAAFHDQETGNLGQDGEAFAALNRGTRKVICREARLCAKAVDLCFQVFRERCAK